MSQESPEIPELTESLILPVFKQFFEDFEEDSEKTLLDSKKSSPIGCQVITVDPIFTISDGFHIISCEFTREAIYQFKYWYPTDSVKNLTQHFLMINKYTPIVNINKENKLVCSLRIHEVEYHPDGYKFAPIQGSPVPLSQSSDYQELEQNAIAEFVKAQIPDVTKIGTDPEPEADPLIVKGNTIVEVNELKKNPYLSALTPPAIDYKEIESLEKELGKEADEAFNLKEEAKREKLKKKREEEGYIRKKYKKRAQEDSEDNNEENKGEGNEKKPHKSKSKKGLSKEDMEKFKKWKEVISETIGPIMPEREHKRGKKRRMEFLEAVGKGKERKLKEDV